MAAIGADAGGKLPSQEVKRDKYVCTHTESLYVNFQNSVRVIAQVYSKWEQTASVYARGWEKVALGLYRVEMIMTNRTKASFSTALSSPDQTTTSDR